MYIEPLFWVTVITMQNNNYVAGSLIQMECSYPLNRRVGQEEDIMKMDILSPFSRLVLRQLHPAEQLLARVHGSKQ